MKKGYKRLLIFEILLLAMLFINSFIYNFLSGFNISIFLVIVLILFKYLFGFEKDKQRFVKDIILDVIIFLIIFLLLYYLSGILIGFYKADNYYTLYGLKTFILPIICYILLREYLRYNMMRKREGSKLLSIITIIFFIFLDLTTSIYYGSFETNYDTFVFVSLNILPAISSNIIFSYITTKVGYRPIIIYALVINLYPYLIPIVPNPSQYLVSLVDLLVPIFLGYTVYKFFKTHEKNEKPVSNDKNRKKQFIALIPLTILVATLVYFTSGYFRMWAIVIASGSMQPEIYKGDIVIVDKKVNYDKLKKGQVIAYETGGVVIVHRLTNKATVDGTNYYVTKGDANKEEDNIIITNDMIVGVVNFKIPYLGLPKVWLNGL